MSKLLPFLPFPEAADEEEASPIPILPPDVEARASALDIHRSFIVEAPAGSGKTGLLIQRFLKLLADESVTSPEQVLAITFTLKATAELRDRVLSHLESASSNIPVSGEFALQTRTLAQSVLTRDRQLNWSLLDHPHRLNIRTIDSVSSEIARTLPVLSGSGGRLAPVLDAQPLYREAARRTLLLLGSGDPVLDAALRDLLLHRDGNLADCEALLADMLALREQWGTLIPLTPATLDDAWLDTNVLPRLQAALEQAICAELTSLSQAFDPAILADLTELAAAMSHSLGYKGALSPITICRDRTQSPSDRAEDLEHWRSLIHLLIKPSKPRDWRKSVSSNVVKFEIEKHHESRLKQIIARLSNSPDLIEILCRIDSLPPAQYPPNQWLLAKSLFRILSRALVELQLVFSTRGQCDFTELSLLARAALTTDSGPEDLSAALGARLQHLLVDEMQDTSAAQYELIQLLTSSWDGHSQTVFLVGDPRQSIYLFRQARVERFVHTMRTQRLGDLPLTRLRLTANFRSQQTLVEHFNQNFALVFNAANGPATHALPYTPADPILPPSPTAQSLVWQITPVALAPSQTRSIPTTPPTPTSPQLRQRQMRRDAAKIRTIARAWLDKPLPPGRTEPWKIAVLVRNRNHLVDIVAAFNTPDRSARTIPYRAVDITPLNERQEILDLTALTRALLHPADRVAAMAVLRAPWCGLPLADLLTLTGADDPAFKDHSIHRLMSDRGHLLPEPSIQRLQRVWHIFTEAAHQRSRLSAAQLVERAWRSLGGDAWLTPPELLNTRRFFQLLDQLESELGAPGRIDPTLLDARLQRLYAEPNAYPPHQPFVDLLTIHAAKGLEWDVVIVPALERRAAFPRSRLLVWSELPTSGDPNVAPIMLAPIAAKGEEIDPLTSWLKTIYREREAAERKRLFYVAATRAREELHLFAAPDLLVTGTINPWPDSLLKSALSAAQPHFPTTPPQAAPQPIVLDLAAASDTLHLIPRTANLETAHLRPSQPSPLLRLPITFDPTTRFTTAQPLPYGDPTPNPTSDSTLFSRPEGSFAARSFGNVVHTFLELLATRIAAGDEPNALLAELPTWTPRIAAILRADGLPTPTVDRLTRDTRTALENTLRNPDGLWLLSPHRNAATELALTAQQSTADPLASIRVDRIFHAGPEPRAPGHSHLWIIDYKTTAHGPSGLDDFLAQQRAAYAPQLETYASILAPSRATPANEVRLALFYPTIPRLLCWTPTIP